MFSTQQIQHHSKFLYLLQFLILGILLSSLLSSCKKDRSTPQDSGPIKNLRATQVTNPNGHSILTNYAYNDLGQVYQEELKDESTGVILYQNYRFRDGQLYASDIQNDEKRLSRINYSYLAGQLRKISYLDYDFYQNTNLLFEQELEYKDQQLYQIITKNHQGQLSTYIRFQFQDGNVTETKSYSADGKPIQTLQYEHDQMINPYKGHFSRLIEPVAYNKSNITKLTITDHQNNSFTQESYSYQYNSSGQPTAQFKKGESKKAIISFFY